MVIEELNEELHEEIILESVERRSDCICGANKTEGESGEHEENGGNRVNHKENKKKYHEKLQYEALWKRFGNHYCINLKSRPDRLKAASEQFHAFGLCRLVKFFIVTPPTDEECKKAGVISRGRFGCWRSHQLLSGLLLRNKKDDSQVHWEDDFVFRNDQMSVLRVKQVLSDFENVVKKLPFHAFKFGQHSRSGAAVPCVQSNADSCDPSLHRPY